MGKKTLDTMDRISVLPDSIVHHILSYLLDDPKSRVRMSVLSKRWFTLTASFPILYFRLDGPWFCLLSRKYDLRYIRQSFYRYVEYTVSRFCKQNISAHTLNILADTINFEQIKLIGRCLDLVLETGLQMMDIQFESHHLPMFRLPNTLLSASSLTSLTLHKCELPSSLMVGIVKFKSLRLLSLSYLPLDEGVIEYLTKASPILEEIYLKNCYGFKTFCVKRHQNLLKLEIYCKENGRLLLERIDVEAPNLNFFLLVSSKNKAAPSMFMGSCKKLTTFCYSGFPLKRFNDFLSNFPFLENVSLNLSSPVDNLKLSHHCLRRLELQLECDLEEIDLNAPNLNLFKYNDITFRHNVGATSRKDSSLVKGYMKYRRAKYFDILSFLKLRQFLEKNSIFKVVELVFCWKLIDVEELKLIQSSPYELEHVELTLLSFIKKLPVYVSLVDVVLWCCRPRSLTLGLFHFTNVGDVVEYAYKKLLQQEDEGQTNIKFVLISSTEDKQPFSDLSSLLEALSLEQSRCTITFIKEEGSGMMEYANHVREVQKVTCTRRKLDYAF